MLSSVVDLMFPVEWLKAALVLAFFSTWVVIGVFAYLNSYTKKLYFSLWTVGWMFYAVWLAATIGLEESPDAPFLVMVRRACIGISALFMFWGSLELNGRVRKQRELGWGIVMIVIWSYVGAYQVRDQFWITMPVFALLGCVGLFIGYLYWRRRKRNPGANLLTVGFALWGVHFIVFPLITRDHSMWMSIGYVASSVLATLIAFGMIMMVLAEARERNEALRDEFKKGVARRRLLREEITVSEQKYRALFDSASDAIFLVDLETMNIVEANEAAKYFLSGNMAQNAVSFLDICPGLQSCAATLLENKRKVDDLFQTSGEFPMLRSNGMRVLCEGSSNLVQYNHRPALQLNIREITERKQLEQRLRQSEKLSALGQLIAGVAHELNNPLAVIMGYSQLLSRQSGNDAKRSSDAMKIFHESERAAKIVRNLLTFARPRDPQMVSVDLNGLVRALVEKHAHEAGANEVALTVSLDPKLPRTMADELQIDQVLTNLIVNALQALSTHNGSRQLNISTEFANSVIRASVADSGPGIAADLVSKIFDPFFTTKAPGKGTGLGLSLCYSIMEEHRGRIWVETEPGKGAKFVIELPYVPCAETNPGGNELVRPMPIHRHDALKHRILVVDDEPGIVEVLRSLLSASGYTVEAAGNGREAMERIERGHYDVIISDLFMPGMDGVALYKEINALDPDLARRIIFVTGDTVSAQSRAFLERTGNRWLAKPFNLAEVEQTVGNFVAEPSLPVAVG
jgi:PAS domain S-box-containing protein